jgi:DNA repair protein SbcC/Rad50
VNPLRLRATNFRTYADLDLELPDGCTAVTGPNGSGKSSLVNLVELCLFGGRLADHLSDTGAEDMMVELVFEHRGSMYRVRRSYSARGRGKTTLDFEHARPAYTESDLRAGIALAQQGVDPGMYYDEWQPLTLESAKATQALIEQTLGFTRDTWRASSFLAQGDGAAFCEADPRDRKRILAEAVLGRDPVWPRLLDACRQDKRRAETLVAELSGALDRADEELARLPAVEEQAAGLHLAEAAATSALVEAERRLQEITDRYRRIEQQVADRRVAEAAVSEASQRASALGQVLVSAEDAAEQLPDLDAWIVVLEGGVAAGAAIAERNRALEQARSEWQRAKAERDRLLNESEAAWEQAADLRDKADHLLGHIGEAQACDRCGQSLGEEAARRAAQSFRDEAAKLTGKGDEADQALKALVVGVEPEAPEPVPAEILNAPGELGAARERRTGLLERVAAAADPDFQAKSREAREALAQAEAALAAIPAVDASGLQQIQQEGLDARANVNQARQTRDQAVADHARIRADLDRLTRLGEQTAHDRRERQRLLADIDQLAILERAYSPNGIPMLLIENAAIPQIETEANRILSELGGVATHVELRTQRELKSGDGLADALDVVVFTENGDRDYATLSGGERARVNVALRIALARLLASRRGAESELLVLDEVEYLDEEGQARLCDVLAELEGDFRKVILVSHVPGLRDVFEQVIEVCKEDGVSRVAGAAEQVPA